ncbi:MAG: DMT family transporter [Rhizobiaceae bacterium]|nr:DMT family transporter [Rhizobiaceae bacterium]MCV0408624.1 DMT family transporter [Rhizobiaceae bacterium]
MSFYLQFVFIIFSAGMGLIFGDGRFGDTGSANLDFILRAWIWPNASDWLAFLLIGAIGSVGAFLVSQAYRIAEAGLVAPFEYVAMPLAVFWSLVIWGDWPDFMSWLGIVLIAGAGIFIFLREATLGRYPLGKRQLPPSR